MARLGPELPVRGTVRGARADSRGADWRGADWRGGFVGVMWAATEPASGLFLPSLARAGPPPEPRCSDAMHCPRRLGQCIASATTIWGLPSARPHSCAVHSARHQTEPWGRGDETVRRVWDEEVRQGDGQDGFAAQLASSLRVLRASRGLSQRGLAEATGVSKSVVARLEAGSLPPGVTRWLATVADLGLEVTLVPVRSEDGQGEPPPHRDAAGRRFPAHVVARQRSMPPTWWFVRNGGWGTRTPEPEWFWRRRT